MCGGGKTKTSTSSSSALPQYADAYSGILSQAQNVASTPYNTNTNQQVAGFNPTQNQAFDATQGNLGTYQPYLGQAASSLSNGNLTPQSIQQFMSPYTQNVVDATQAQFANQNAQQAQSLNANAAKIGALTGDRSQVAQGVLAGQQQTAQAPVIAGLYNQGYQSAAQTAGQAAGLANQNAALASSIGGQAQQYGLNDINSLWGAGQAQQTQQQNVLNANTANAQAQAAYPFNTTQWLSSLATGLGGAAGTTGTQTTPGPSIWSQLLGAGIAGASLIPKAAGGRVGYDSGGVVAPAFNGNPYPNARSYVPTTQMPHGGMNHPGPMPSLADQTGGGFSDLLNNYKQAHSTFQGLGNLGSTAWNYGNTTTDPASGFSTTVSPSSMSGMGNYLSNMFGFSDGGMVRGYDDGGAVANDDIPFGAWNQPSPIGSEDGWTPTVTPAVADNDVPYGDWNSPNPIGSENGPWSPEVTSAPSLPAPMGLGATPQMPSPQPAPAAGPMATPYQLPTSGSIFGIPVSDAARQGLLQAGLGMMASQSPFIGTAIGEGGLAGARAYGEAKQQAIQDTQAKTRIDMEAQRLALAAKQAAENLRINSAQEARAAQTFPLDLQSKEMDLHLPKAIGQNEWGKTIYGQYDPASKTYKPIGATDTENTSLSPSGAVAADGSPLTGDAYLKTLPQSDATLVQKMVNGEIQPPSSYVLARSERWNKLLDAAGQYEPGFDLTSWGARVAGRKDFYGGGKSSEMVRAANQTIDHVGHLVESFDKLNNTQYPVVNEVKNYANQKISGTAGVPDFLANAHAVADEMSKVFKGANMSDTEVKAWEASLNPSMSPEQQHAAVGKLMDLLNGSLNALESKRESSLGPTLSKKYGPLLTPHSQEVLARVKKWSSGEAEAVPGKVQGQLGNQPGPGAVEHLRANPQLAKAFDEKFGPGSAARALGGQ